MSGVPVSNDVLRSALSAGLTCAIVLLVIELARAGMVILSIVSTMALHSRYPDAPRPWDIPTVQLSYGLLVIGLIVTIVLVIKLSAARRELDRM